MKTLVSVLLLISLNAMAAQTKALPQKLAKSSASTDASMTVINTTSQTTMTTSVSPQSAVLKKLSVGAILSQADTFKGATVTNGSYKADADINSSSSLGLVAQLTEFAKWNKIGWFAAMSVEQTRELSSIKVEGNNMSIAQKPSFRPWIASGGANYEFNSNFYGFAGLNYTLYTEKNSGLFGSYEMFPQLGYQYGVGGKIQQVSVEIAMREVAYDMSLRKGDLKVEGHSTLAGLNLQARYNF